jgi:hypothetical protein
MTRIAFTKMHGIGNDYIYIDALSSAPPDPGRLARRLSDRHFGVGSDGLVLIRPSKQADFMMDMYNSDGSRGLMCGNAIRCVAKYVFERGLTERRQLAIETLSGVKSLDLQIQGGQVGLVTVNMGPPEFTPARIPVRWQDKNMVDEPIAYRRPVVPPDVFVDGTRTPSSSRKKSTRWTCRAWVRPSNTMRCSPIGSTRSLSRSSTADGSGCASGSGGPGDPGLRNWRLRRPGGFRADGAIGTAGNGLPQGRRAFDRLAEAIR